MGIWKCGFWRMGDWGRAVSVLVGVGDSDGVGVGGGFCNCDCCCLEWSFCWRRYWVVVWLSVEGCSGSFVARLGA